MNILYIAYSCSPNSGSENSIGWNIPIEMAKRHSVYVLTKQEHREHITNYLKENPIETLHFFFVDIPGIFKKIFKGFLYSARLNIWHNLACPMAKQICEKYGIQVIHQITPIEFRSIGNYGGRIMNVKFVCGPIGGGEYIPKALCSYAKSHKMTEYIRKLFNSWYKFYFTVNKRFDSCDYICYANNETRDYIGIKGHVMTEVGIDFCKKKEKNIIKSDKRIFLLAGRIIYRKGYLFLFDVLERIPDDLCYEVRVVGDGPDLLLLKRYVGNSEKLKKHVVFVGKIPYTQMQNEYRGADVFIMPSIRETTGSVMLEALANGIPVIAINHFGSALMLNNEIGWKYDGITKDDYISSLLSIMIECIKSPQICLSKGEKAFSFVQNYTWRTKIFYFEKIYKELLQ